MMPPAASTAAQVVFALPSWQFVVLALIGAACVFMLGMIWSQLRSMNDRAIAHEASDSAQFSELRKTDLRHATAISAIAERLDMKVEVFTAELDDLRRGT